MCLLRRIELYLQRTRMTPTAFGRMVASDPRLIPDLRRGRIPGPVMRARIDAALAQGDRPCAQ